MEKVAVERVQDEVKTNLAEYLERASLSNLITMLDRNSKIYIAGHHGLVGSAIWKNLEARGYHNLVGRSHDELDLTDQYQVQKLLMKSSRML